MSHACTCGGIQRVQCALNVCIQYGKVFPHNRPAGLISILSDIIERNEAENAIFLHSGFDSMRRHINTQDGYTNSVQCISMTHIYNIPRRC